MRLPVPLALLPTVLLGLLLTSPRAAAQTPALNLGCPAWTVLNPADVRAAQVSAARALFTNAAGQISRVALNRDDLVLQGPSVNGRRCTYLVREGEVTGVGGFLTNFQVRPVATAATLSGRWTSGADSVLTLQRRSNEAVDFTAVNGGLQGLLSRQPDGWLSYAGGDCRLNVWPVGAWLLVQDSGRCATTLNFSGLYRRER
ncbi:hypothetical protein LAJ19_11460 [Deinococcus taeanensis]|uniref:hypothetical protein n=1 Tax=Deinococcus taeanensis TaxID=2737050 RepID=UPI001CDC5FF9|nr:hypothetical protein [Deinococcus taeanensis]UBV42234.1 hypothetical protein LAJ19_11460 [Deinococcus taeanensis]